MYVSAEIICYEIKQMFTVLISIKLKKSLKVLKIV